MVVSWQRKSKILAMDCDPDAEAQERKIRKNSDLVKTLRKEKKHYLFNCVRQDGLCQSK